MARSRLQIGEKGPDFRLPGVNGKDVSIADFSASPVLVVMFTCNHCPYVQAYEDRLIALQAEYAAKGVSFVAINANDVSRYPEDSFKKMVERAKKKHFNFPYLRDEKQAVVSMYGAEYTPEIFVLDRERTLRYTGRIDDNWKDAGGVTRRDLKDAIDALLAGRPVPDPETHAIGCTIKWADL